MKDYGKRQITEDAPSPQHLGCRQKTLSPPERGANQTEVRRRNAQPRRSLLSQHQNIGRPQKHGLTLVIALSSPQDAGSTAGQLGQVLLSELKNIEIVEFDSDQLHNYRARRPYHPLRKRTLRKATIPAAEALTP